MATNIVSQRNKSKLAYDGHIYVFDKLSKDGHKEFWRCQFKNSSTEKCKARLHNCVESRGKSVVGIHTDMPSPAVVEVQQKKTALKRRAADTVEAPHSNDKRSTVQELSGRSRCDGEQQNLIEIGPENPKSSRSTSRVPRHVDPGLAEFQPQRHFHGLRERPHERLRCVLPVGADSRMFFPSSAKHEETGRRQRPLGKVPQ